MKILCLEIHLKKDWGLFCMYPQNANPRNSCHNAAELWWHWWLMALLFAADEFSDKHLFLGKQLVSSMPKLRCCLASLFCGGWCECFQSNFVPCRMRAEWDGSQGGSVDVSIYNSKYLNECARGQGSNSLMLEGTCNPTHSWAVLQDSFQLLLSGTA